MSQVNAAILTGGVDYTVKDAGLEAFSSPAEVVDFNFVQLYLIDANYNDNVSALLTGEAEFDGRRVASFSDGSYGVVYNDKQEFAWYYNSGGRLISYTKLSSANYPSKITRYKPDGTIINRGLKVSESESFVFSTDGKLLAHWIGRNCYDENNKLTMTRRNSD